MVMGFDITMSFDFDARSSCFEIVTIVTVHREEAEKRRDIFFEFERKIFKLFSSGKSVDS